MKRCNPNSRSAICPPYRRIKLHLDCLEDRLTPTGFGPADGAYIVESWIGSYKSVKIQPTDQKIVAAGEVRGLSQNQGVALARYDSLGNPDTGYGVGGLATPSNPPGGQFTGGLVLQPDGKAVVSTTISGNLGVGRFKTNGTLDTTFSGDGWASVNVSPNQIETATGIGLQSNGQIIVGGVSNIQYDVFDRDAIMAGFKTNGALASGKGGFGDIVNNKATGTITSTFGGATAAFTSILVQPDNRIVAVGTYTTEVSTLNRQLLVARYTAQGSLDTTFNGTGYTVLTLPGISYTASFESANGVLQADGKIVVVSSAKPTDTDRDMLVTRFNSNGTLDTSFGGGTGYVRFDIDGTGSITHEYGIDVMIQPDGKILAVGFAEGEYLSGTPNTVFVARYDSDGMLDSTFGTDGVKLSMSPSGLNFRPYGAALKSDGSIIVAGIDREANQVDHPFLMRFYGTSSPLQATGTPGTISNQTITQAQIAPLLTEAIARWRSAGFNTSSLSNINLRIADLPGTTLGQAQGNTITLDTNAAGWGWFVDKTPRSDSEFRTRGNQGEQGHMDLLTVLMHETGHMLGRSHTDHGLMAETLSAGQRLTLPTATDAAFLFRELSQFSKSRRTDLPWVRA